jgi:putative peptide-modifying radical SAM enzyme
MIHHNDYLYVSKNGFSLMKAKGLLYFILTTGECNLSCRYCGGSFPMDQVPWKINYELKLLKNFIEKDDDATIAFYGGEPLVNSKFVEEVIDKIGAKRFVIQTNGILIDRLREDCWNRMDAILLSIDGTEKTTDYYRGDSVYQSVIKAAKKLKKIGYHGDLIARMAVSEQTDIYNDVMHLVGLGLFDHIHWQLDVGWSDSWIDFEGWVERSYKQGILKLVDKWTSEMSNGNVLGLVPFLGILKRMKEGGVVPPCGSGVESFSIMPDGKIRACPISFDAGWSVIGELDRSMEATLHKVEIVGECNVCDYLNVCGARCLYFNRERLWGKKGFEAVCELTKFTIDLIESRLESIEKMVRDGKIDFDDLDYPKFNNSTEIIP